MPEGDDRAPGDVLGAAPPVDVAFLAAVIDSLGHPLVVKDREFRFVLVNEALSEMIGFPARTMLGRTDFEFFKESEARFFREMDTRVFATGETVVTEEPITDASGAKHVLTTTKRPLLGPGGEVTHVVGIIHDITRLKAAEDDLRVTNEELERRVRARTAALQAAQSELVRSERLAVLGQLAGGLAHQIRNPLGAITNAAYVLQRTVARHPDADASRAIAIILEEVWQANRIITDLIDYARVRMPERRDVDLAVVIDQALDAVVRGAVVIERALLPVPRVSVDPDQVRDALVNLIKNAVEAMPGGGTLKLATRDDGDEVELVISDTGPGIPKEMRDRLFEPLVSTKPLGLGLGLTTARALIQNQGGSIGCESPDGQGTRFVIRLPAAPGG
jgi:PAS domain S-box-containing protein